MSGCVAETRLIQDSMRYMFIRTFVAIFRSMGEAALQGGKSEAIIRRDYLNPKVTD